MISFIDKFFEHKIKITISAKESLNMSSQIRISWLNKLYMEMLKSQRMMAVVWMEETVHSSFSERRKRTTVGTRMWQ